MEKFPFLKIALMFKSKGLDSVMKLEEIYKKLFDRSVEQWRAFQEICELMGCGDRLAELLQTEYTSAYDALVALNPMLQEYLFRAGKNNPFGAAKERYEIEGKMTGLHGQVAEKLLLLGSHRAKFPLEFSDVDAVFILGSTVPNMANRIKYYKDEVMPYIRTCPKIFGLSGERILIPAKQEAERAYLGDFTESPIEGYHFLTLDQLQSTLASYHKDGKPTEAGAMAILMQQLLPEHKVEIINAKAKAGATRPDTEDTAIAAGEQLKGRCFDDFKLVIVSDACFPGQKEQVIAGLLKAGISLQKEQIAFYGRGYSDQTLLESAAYTQIVISSLAEQVYNAMKRLELEPKASVVVGSFIKNPTVTTKSDACEHGYSESRGWSYE